MEHILYQVPPSTPIALDDLEDATIRRLALLLSLQGKESTTYNCSIDKDVHGHFGLRVVFAMIQASSAEKTDMCEWFIKQETLLLQQRLLESIQPRRDLIRDMLQALDAVSYDEEDNNLLVPFQDIPFLVRSRSVILRSGVAHIPLESRHAVFLVAHHARKHFESQLEIQARACCVHPASFELERLYPLRVQVEKALQDALSSRSFVSSSLEHIGDKAGLERYERCLPLCMRYLFDKLRHDHHLKYEGRNQLRMFLKGVGFTFEENMIFWRSMLVSKAFDKKYAYNIRHSYGLVGSRFDYEPWSCATIQNLPPPSAGQFHGCPFQRWESEFLKRQLLQYGGISTTTASQIASIAATEAPLHPQQSLRN
ncbi:unnamed protein product [Aphanomyces euteiches]